MLSKLVGVTDGDVISVVGSGGKTSFVYCLSKELGNKKVLVSTTTKMFVPAIEEVDYIGLDKNNFRYVINSNETGTFFMAEKCDGDSNKVQSMPLNKLSELSKEFQVTILESDGAKRKLVKAWDDFEPVVIESTTKTVGIVNISMIGKNINEENIHRLERFQQLIKGRGGEQLTVEHYLRIITDDNGLFRKSVGERVLFINGADTEALEKVAIKLMDMIKESNCNIHRVIYGSLKEKRFYR